MILPAAVHAGAHSCVGEDMIRRDGAVAEEEMVRFCTAEHPRLVGALSLYCGDADLAEEFAQEALARVCRDWARVSRVRWPGAYTHRVGMNLANSWFRRRAAERRAVQRQATRPDGGGPDVADALVVRAAVAALPRRQRTALVLRYYSDLPAAQAADLMGCARPPSAPTRGRRSRRSGPY